MTQTQTITVLEPPKTLLRSSRQRNIRGELLSSARYHDFGEMKNTIKIPPDDEHKVWTGTISPKKRVHNRELSQSEVDEILSPENLEQYYVKASEDISTRCIDGRCIFRYGSAEAPQNRPIGPQVPGGTAAAALCCRVANGDSIHAHDFTFSDDIGAISEQLEEHGLEIGGHIDDHAREGVTGCGAIDKIPDILKHITIPESQEPIRHIVKALLGEKYARNVVDEMMGRFLSLQGKKRQYLSVDTDGQYHYRTEVIRALKDKNPRGVEKLIGQHHEVALVINLVPETTFHRDQFAVDNDYRIQLFNYDFWRSIELAETLYPDDSDLQQRYLTTRSLFAVATAMTLTDGSIKLIVRTPRNNLSKEKPERHVHKRVNYT